MASHSMQRPCIKLCCCALCAGQARDCCECIASGEGPPPKCNHEQACHQLDHALKTCCPSSIITCKAAGLHCTPMPVQCRELRLWVVKIVGMAFSGLVDLCQYAERDKHHSSCSMRRCIGHTACVEMHAKTDNCTSVCQQVLRAHLAPAARAVAWPRSSVTSAVTVQCSDVRLGHAQRGRADCFSLQPTTLLFIWTTLRA